MKFHFGPVPDNLDFTPDTSWHPLDEPSPKIFVWVALPFGLLAAIAFYILWFGLTDLMIIDFLYWLYYQNTILSIALLFIGLIIAHELIHSAFHPGYGLSSKPILGLWPSKGAFYAYWDDEWNRNRAITCIISPFLVLTVLLLLVCLLPYTFVPWLDANTASMLCYISLLNAFFACGDLMGARLLFWQIPQNAIVRNKGFRIYWRPKN